MQPSVQVLLMLCSRDFADLTAGSCCPVQCAAFVCKYTVCCALRDSPNLTVGDASLCPWQDDSRGVTSSGLRHGQLAATAHLGAARWALLHSCVPPHATQVIRGEWDVAAVASQAWDIADKVVGTVGGGRIGTGLIRRLRARPGPGMHD